jgi:hypothetical protein
VLLMIFEYALIIVYFAELHNGKRNFLHVKYYRNNHHV